MRKFILALLLTLAASPALGQDTTSNLEAHYTFETDGSDETVNNRDLTASSSTPVHGAGAVGSGLTRGRYTLADATFLNSSATYTITTWLYSNHRPETDVVTIGPSAQDALILMAAGTSWTSGTLNTLTSGGARRAKPATPGTPGPPVWEFRAVVCSSGTATVYSNRDGSLVAAAASGNWTLPATAVAITVGPGGYAAGIDECRIFSRALALADVQALEAE